MSGGKQENRERELIMRIRNDSDPYLSIELTEHAAYKKSPESLLWIVSQMRVPGVFCSQQILIHGKRCCAGR